MSRTGSTIVAAMVLATLSAGALTVHAFAPPERPGAQEDPFSPLFGRRLEIGIQRMERPADRILIAHEQLVEDDPVTTPASGLLSVCLASGCALSVCLGSGCIQSFCFGSACQGSACGGSACLVSGCGGSACLGSGCFGSVCVGSGCLGSACVGCGTAPDEETEPPEA